ncbi:AtpZ/AtpI family protein [Neobacillus jeddahensis]|uniref:AtpZ/AtpI family protein n=1 Tax=Neobacillus jeddahensis TaxID=1461580 RepID=UPI00058E77E4|nr:AtpZ/AtpI family protein [Neobacillus jeddahensis]
MKHKFTKQLGRVEENLELGLEEKWIYVHYTKGSIEKTACLLKNANKSNEEYLEDFFVENQVSTEMIKEVTQFIKNDASHPDTHWNEFSSFLMKALSLNMVFGIAAAISIYFGYKSGAFLDDRYELYPTFTLIGSFLGIGLGGLTIYSMVQRYFKSSIQKERETENTTDRNDNQHYPVIDVTIDEVRRAVRTFSDKLPKGVYRTILVNDDNSIDFTQIAEFLGGVPSKIFYMSKETYDLFEESEKIIPYEMDMVQKAVDQYVKEHNEYPMLKFDPQHRVNYYQLMQDHYLKKTPETQFYMTDLDGLITHIKPKKKNSSQL